MMTSSTTKIARKGHTKFWVLGSIAVAIIVVLILMTINNATSPVSGSSEAPQVNGVSISQMPAPSAAPASDGLEEGQLATVADFIAAFHSQRWDDPQPTSWLTRVVPLVTSAYLSQLKATYGSAVGGPTWRDFVDEQTIRAGILDSAQGNLEESAPGTVIVLATFHVEVTTAANASTEPLTTKMIVLTKTSGKWLVSSFGEIAAGSDTSPAKSTKSPAPTVHD